ncbi:MAG TPA: DUF2911 domain-containing protein [Pyrinomonadaceae bacterium]|nr:DUF2911 domain-containing protein [Pyrinomonadaceae bacterium]
MHKKILCSVAVLLLAGLSILMTAQDQAGGQQKPPLSPPATAEGTIGGQKVSIKYSAPSMRNRKIMGELVPYGKVWRTGANAATTLETSADLMIGDLRVPKGTYTLYTLPGETEWKLIVSKQTGQWGTDYSEAQDLGRVNLSVKKTASPVEKFMIALEPGGANDATLKMSWENTEVSAPVKIAG